MRCLLYLCLIGAITCPALMAQEPARSSPTTEIDFSALVRELQQSPGEPGYTGLVWWIPTEYWEISAERSGTSEDKAKERYAPLKKYTLVAVAVGKIGIGNIDWVPEAEIRDKVFLRDSEGNSYPPVQNFQATPRDWPRS
jgi:hypothetical protein